MILYKHTPAFSIATAIAVMLIMGILSSFVLSISSSTAKETYAQYRKEQAALLAQAYTEAAILQVLQTNILVGNNCTTALNANITTTVLGAATSGVALIASEGRGYNVSVNVQYIANGLTNINTTTLCPNTLNVDSAGLFLDFNASFGVAALAKKSILIDVYVRYKDPMHTNVAASPWINYHRRTLQKI